MHTYYWPKNSLIVSFFLHVNVTVSIQMLLSVYKCHCQYTNVIVSIQMSLSVY